MLNDFILDLFVNVFKIYSQLQPEHSAFAEVKVTGPVK